jgi:hypothetical protein
MAVQQPGLGLVRLLSAQALQAPQVLQAQKALQTLQTQVLLQVH